MSESVVKTYNNQFMIKLDHVPVKKGLIYIPNAERRKLPCGVVEMVPEGYDGEVKVGERYLIDNQRCFRLDKERVLITLDNMWCRVERGSEDELQEVEVGEG